MGRLALALAAMLVTSCNPTAPGAATTVSSSTTTPSSSRFASPSPAMVGSPASPAASSSVSGIAAAKQVAIDGAVKQTGATYLDGNVDVGVACPASSTECLVIQSEVDGEHAAYFRGRMGALKQSAACFIYTVEDPTGWHFLDMVCAGPESGVFWPDVGADDFVSVAAGSCANVRATPGLSGRIVACLGEGQIVTIDGGPVYLVEPPPSVSHLWWHVKGKGWMAHNFLVPS